MRVSHHQLFTFTGTTPLGARCEFEIVESAAQSAAYEIWANLSDRRGFGLSGIEDDDPDTFKEIIESITRIIEQEYESKGEAK